MGMVVSEKSLTKERLTHTHTHTHRHTDTYTPHTHYYGKDKNYIPTELYYY